MRYLLTFLGLLTLASAVAQDRELRDEIDTLLRLTNTPGAAVVVIHKDSLILSAGFGYRDLDKGHKVNAQTLFPIGSSTKAFTAVLVGIAHELDSIDIDHPPTDYLPNLEFYEESMTSGIRIRDLLSHRTGLPRHDLSWYLFPEQDKIRLAQRLKYLQPFASLREKYHYNNLTYMLLGLLAEKSLGNTWHELLDRHLFNPLGMKRSFTEQVNPDRSNMALGYRTSAEGISTVMPYYDLQGMAPAGSIVSSAEDMGYWLHCWLNQGKFKGKQVIPLSHFAEAISSQMVMRPNLPDDEFKDLFFSNYGFGWMLSAYKGHYRVEHGGNINGFSANVCFYPAASLGIVVLTNQNNSEAPYLIRNTISDRLLGIAGTDWLAYYLKGQEENTTSTDSDPPSGRPKFPGLHIAGTYDHPGYGSFSIEQDGKTTRATFPIGVFPLERTDTAQFQMKPKHQSKVDPETVPELPFEVKLGADGEVQGLYIPMEPTLDPLLFSKTDAHDP